MTPLVSIKLLLITMLLGIPVYYYNDLFPPVNAQDANVQSEFSKENLHSIYDNCLHSHVRIECSTVL